MDNAEGGVSFAHHNHPQRPDDDESVAGLVCVVLAEVECDANRVQSPHEGLELLRQDQYDLLILDIGLPEMDGSRVVEHIRKDLAFAQLPILIMTAYPDSRRLVRKEVVSGFISKPFVLDELLKTVARILEEKDRGAKSFAAV